MHRAYMKRPNCKGQIFVEKLGLKVGTQCVVNASSILFIPSSYSCIRSTILKERNETIISD